VSYEDALKNLSRDDRFKATIYAMNSLLIYKGIYTQQEFQKLFIEWTEKEQPNRSSPAAAEPARISV
jgi:hypothetical protein